MTALEEERKDLTEDRESGLLLRDYETELIRGDGRTVDVRIVPYGERIVHDDGHGGLPRGIPYHEEFVRGAFDDQLRAANRVDVLMNFEHEPGIGGLIGRGTALRDSPDGLHGTFRIFEGQDGDKILELVREGVLRSVSLEARAKKSVRTADGVILRVKAHLRNVALTRYGAYKGAAVLALREEFTDEVTLDEELLPFEPDPQLLERCRALGIRLPQRYEAHPADTDTPAETGTSEDGTRPTEETPTSEE